MTRSLSPSIRFTQIRPPKDLGVPEIVAITAGLWGLNAFAIDVMLPALGLIARDLEIANPNNRQLMITLYIVCNGFAQLIFGPVIDRFGRRPVLLISLFFYIVASLVSILAPSFETLLAARAAQGASTAGTRVAALAMIRDRFSGRKMANVLSMVVTVFIIAPVIAPLVGQGFLLLGSWRIIFVGLFIYGLTMAIWVTFRVAETLHADEARPVKARQILFNYVSFFKNRTSAGYTAGSALVFGSLFAFIGSAEQVFHEVFDVGAFFGLAFAAIALPFGLASVINSRLVERHGMRRMSHSAMIGYFVVSAFHALVFLSGMENFAIFLALTALGFFAIGMMGPNFTALAMEPMGHIAGSAGAANGFASTAVAGTIGWLIGRQFDGTAGPLIFGILTLSIISIAVVSLTEKGRLFAQADQGAAAA